MKKIQQTKNMITLDSLLKEGYIILKQIETENYEFFLLEMESDSIHGKETVWMQRRKDRTRDYISRCDNDSPRIIELLNFIHS